MASRALRPLARRIYVSYQGYSKQKCQAPFQWSRSASAIHVPTTNPVEEIEQEVKVGCWSLKKCRWLRTHANRRVKQKGASIPCPDPPADSTTARFVESYAPYLVATYSRPPPVMEKGEGCYLWDIENRRYLDFTGGIAVNSLGHCDPEFTKLLSQQVRYKHNPAPSHKLTLPPGQPTNPLLKSLSQHLDGLLLQTPRRQNKSSRWHA